MSTSMRSLASCVREVRCEQRLGEEERGRPANCLSADSRSDGGMDEENQRGEEERHFHQDYPAAENLIWESGPVLTEHTHTRTHTHTQHACTLPQEAENLEELCFTSVCPGKPLS